MDSSLSILGFLEGLGGGEMMLVMVIVLVLFGGQKLPEFARGLGKSIREFKKAAAGVEEEFKRALEEEPVKKPKPTQTALPAPTYTPELTAGAASYDDAGYHDSYHDGSEAGPSAPSTPTPEKTGTPVPGETINPVEQLTPATPVTPLPSPTTTTPEVTGVEKAKTDTTLPPTPPPSIAHSPTPAPATDAPKSEPPKP